MAKPVSWSKSNQTTTRVYCSIYIISAHFSKHSPNLTWAFFFLNSVLVSRWSLLTHAFSSNVTQTISSRASSSLKDTARKLSSHKSPQLEANQRSAVVKGLFGEKRRLPGCLLLQNEFYHFIFHIWASSGAGKVKTTPPQKKNPRSKCLRKIVNGIADYFYPF